MVLFWLYRHGHHTVSLVGGATGKVGDPSGRLTSRAKTTEAVIQANLESMYAQLEQLWENAKTMAGRHGGAMEETGKLELLNNAQWLDNLNILEFLRVMGNGMRLGALLGRDTVKNKMEKGDGMSFSEFTYPLLQAWDWWRMYLDKGVQVQIGGGDQYGNIIAGIDAVKYIAQSQAHGFERRAWVDGQGRLMDEACPMGLTVPLLTTSSGEKFGKSAGNAIWLDRTLTSSFDLYGFLLRSADDDVERYLKLFTFLPITAIETIMTEHKMNPGQRKAQHLLAGEVIQLVHGAEEAEQARAEHQAMRSPTVNSLTQQSTSDEAANETIVKLPKSLVHDTPLARILYHAGIAATKSEGARLIAKGGIYVASISPQEDDKLIFTAVKNLTSSDVESLIIDGRLMLRLGKWKVRVIEVVSDEEFEASGQDAPGRS
ncbi:hypothetical protein BT93_L5252, partial [Corymbia citriodora subsp. variegata]